MGKRTNYKIKMNQDQLEVLLSQIGHDLQELKVQLATTSQNLSSHIKEFDAHSEPIRLPSWMKNRG